jgi:long-subunit fatty acid transport protein
VVPALQGLYLGAAWRGATGLPIDVDVNLQVNAGTGQIGDIPPASLPLYLALQLGIFDHYQPSQLSFGAAYRLQDALTFSADVRRTAWDQMTVSVAKVTTATVNGALVDLSDLTVEDGNPYAITLAPTWSPRIGADLAFPAIDGGKRAGEIRIVTRGGLGYEPSPLVSQTASSALLDADRLLFAVGAGVSHDDPLHPKGARRIHWDAFFQYHLLANGALDRGTPTTPTAGYSVDGSAVPIGGHLYAAGLTWRSEY